MTIEPIPIGNYNIKYIQTNQFGQVEMMITDGAFKGRTLFGRIRNLLPKKITIEHEQVILPAEDQK